jgi:hypothetical protein
MLYAIYLRKSPRNICNRFYHKLRLVHQRQGVLYTQASVSFELENASLGFNWQLLEVLDLLQILLTAGEAHRILHRLWKHHVLLLWRVWTRRVEILRLGIRILLLEWAVVGDIGRVLGAEESMPLEEWDLLLLIKFVLVVVEGGLNLVGRINPPIRMQMAHSSLWRLLLYFRWVYWGPHRFQTGGVLPFD